MLWTFLLTSAFLQGYLEGKQQWQDALCREVLAR